MLYRFWMLTIGMTFFACSISANCHFRQSDVPDFSCILRRFQRAQRFFDRHLGIDAMQLIKIDPLEFQSFETFIDALRQIFRPSVRHPLIWSGRVLPPLVAITNPFG